MQGGIQRRSPTLRILLSAQNVLFLSLKDRALREALLVANKLENLLYRVFSHLRIQLEALDKALQLVDEAVRVGVFSAVAQDASSKCLQDGDVVEVVV